VDVENGGFDRLGLSFAWNAICQLPPPPVSSFIQGAPSAAASGRS